MDPGSESGLDTQDRRHETGGSSRSHSDPILSAEKVWDKRDPVNESLLHHVLREMIETARNSIVKEIGEGIAHAHYYDPGYASDVTHERMVTVPRRAARVGFGSINTRPNYEDLIKLRKQDVEDALDAILGTNGLSTGPENPRDLVNRGIFAVRPEYEKGKFRGALMVSRVERIEDDGDRELLGRFEDVRGVKRDATHLTWRLTDDHVGSRQVAPVLLSSDNPSTSSLHLVNIHEALKPASSVPTSLESILRHVRRSMRKVQAA